MIANAPAAPDKVIAEAAGGSAPDNACQEGAMPAERLRGRLQQELRHGFGNLARRNRFGQPRYIFISGRDNIRSETGDEQERKSPLGYLFCQGE
jgi:hypothetical protein